MTAKNLDSFMASRALPPMRAAKVRAALEKLTRYEGSASTCTRAELIEFLVGNGRRVESRSHGRVLIGPQGRIFLDESALTKTGLDYAEYLTADD